VKRPVELKPCLQVVKRVATDRVGYTVDSACQQSNLSLALWRGASFQVRHAGHARCRCAGGTDVVVTTSQSLGGSLQGCRKRR
jgi:hypothetical protein